MIGLLRVIVIGVFVFPFLYRYLIRGRPEAYRKASLLAIILSIAFFGLTDLTSMLIGVDYIKSMRMPGYIDPVFGSGREHYFNVQMLFWGAVITGVLCSLLFYLFRYGMRIGHANYSFSENEDEDDMTGWWSNLFVRYIIFAGVYFVISSFVEFLEGVLLE